MTESMADPHLGEGTQSIDLELQCRELGLTGLQAVDLMLQLDTAHGMGMGVIDDHVGAMTKQVVLGDEALDIGVAERAFHPLDRTARPRTATRRPRADSACPSTQNAISSVATAQPERSGTPRELARRLHRWRWGDEPSRPRLTREEGIDRLGDHRFPGDATTVGGVIETCDIRAPQTSRDRLGFL